MALGMPITHFIWGGGALMYVKYFLCILLTTCKVYNVSLIRMETVLTKRRKKIPRMYALLVSWRKQFRLVNIAMHGKYSLTLSLDSLLISIFATWIPVARNLIYLQMYFDSKRAEGVKTWFWKPFSCLLLTDNSSEVVPVAMEENLSLQHSNFRCAYSFLISSWNINCKNTSLNIISF